MAALVMLTLVVAPSAAVLTDAAAASAATPTLQVNASASVTAKGASWLLQVGWSNLTTVGGKADLQVSLTRIVKVKSSEVAFELHTWSMTVPASTASFNTSTGKGTLSVPTQAKPVSTISLSFSKTGAKAGKCSPGSETVYSLAVSGKATLDTGSGTLWAGTLTGSKWMAAYDTATVDKGCVPIEHLGCAASQLAVSGNPTGSTVEMLAASGSLAGSENGESNDVALIRTVKLSAPAGATRADVAGDFLSKVVLLTYDKASKTMKVTTPASGLVHGSASLVASAVFSYSETCSVGKTQYKETTTAGAPAKYTGSLSAKPLMGGTMTAPKSTSTGDFDVTTVAKI